MTMFISAVHHTHYVYDALMSVNMVVTLGSKEYLLRAAHLVSRSGCFCLAVYF